jgi:hypothetical protein
VLNSSFLAKYAGCYHKTAGRIPFANHPELRHRWQAVQVNSEFAARKRSVDDRAQATSEGGMQKAE